MWEESSEQTKTLRTGLTTGSCATACACACAIALLSENRPEKISITLPKGKQVELDIQLRPAPQDNSQPLRRFSASTVKDAGDDPDVTHGATVFVNVELNEHAGVHFFAAEGVGTVTKDGLLLAVGEPAINPVPRQIIRDNLQAIASQYNYHAGFNLHIGIENGEVIAQKTMNSRLGIIGGLSILGTTGIVRPYSCAAWIASIYQGIDVAKANGMTHIAASTGNSSEQAIRQKYQLEDSALIEMGDFAGAVLKHLKKVPIAKLSICGGFGKITKLANGHMDLNSRVSSIDFLHIANTAERLGASPALLSRIKSANTSIEALNLCLAENIDLAQAICEQALVFAHSILPEEVSVEVFAINRQGEFVAHAVD